MAKRWQYLVSALVMALASGSLSVTFHLRAGPAESLDSMNSTDLMKGMPSLDLLVGYTFLKAIMKAGVKEAELPSVGLQVSLLLACFLFTLSYGAGSIKDLNCSIHSAKVIQVWGLSPMLCQAS